MSIFRKSPQSSNSAKSSQSPPSSKFTDFFKNLPNSRLFNKIFRRPPLLAVRFDSHPYKSPQKNTLSSNYTTLSHKSQDFSAKIRQNPPKSAKIAKNSQKFPQNPPTLVFLHGIAASSTTWLPSLKTLATDPAFANSRLIALDLLGFGHSPKGKNLKYTYPEYSAALTRTLKSLHVTTPVILVGHSMGALVAADFALRRPAPEIPPSKSSHIESSQSKTSTKSHPAVSHLLLVSPPVILPDLIARTPDRFYLETYAHLQALATYPGGKALAAFANATTSFESKYLHTPAFQRAMKNIILNPQNYANFVHLKLPTVIVHGRFDPLVYKPNLDKIVKHNPHVQLLTTTSHHDINPAKFAKIRQVLLHFLTEDSTYA